MVLDWQLTIHVCVADEAAGVLQPTPRLPSRFSGQEINENGLNGVRKSAFEPVTSSQNKRRKLTGHPSSDSENNSQPPPVVGDDTVKAEDHHQRNHDQK